MNKKTYTQKEIEIYITDILKKFCKTYGYKLKQIEIKKNKKNGKHTNTPGI